MMVQFAANCSQSNTVTVHAETTEQGIKAKSCLKVGDLDSA